MVSKKVSAVLQRIRDSLSWFVASLRHNWGEDTVKTFIQSASLFSIGVLTCFGIFSFIFEFTGDTKDYGGQSYTLASLNEQDQIAPAGNVWFDSTANETVQVKDLQSLSSAQKNAATWIAKTYKVAPEPVATLVHEAWQLGKKNNIDPTMLLAIVAVESRFNPLAQSPVGAQGLMQVMTKVHTEKYNVYGGIQAAFDPIANMHVGTKILAGYVKQAKSIEGALKYYVGAALHTHDGGYADKVFAQYALLNRVTGLSPKHTRLPKTDTALATPTDLLQQSEDAAANTQPPSKDNASNKAETSATHPAKGLALADASNLETLQAITP